MKKFHESVLLKEAIKYLEVGSGEKYIDATVGGGGHGWEIVKRGGDLLGLDVDPAAIGYFKRKLEDRGWKTDLEVGRLKIDDLTSTFYRLVPPSTFDYQSSAVNLARINFKHIDRIAEKLDFRPVSGILLDLGMSSYQLEGSGRGFSFKREEPLDMRMDPGLKVRAGDLVNGLSRKELYDLFTRLGEESLAGHYSSAIYRARRIKSIATSKQLADIIYKAHRLKGFERQRIHPATKIFQALRIAVNDEINNLKEGLPRAVGLLEPKGHLVVISFHSLEDRQAKSLGQRSDLSRVDGLIRPSEEEIEKNPRASSAKMRIFEKLS